MKIKHSSIKMYFKIITFGCKLNQAESEKIAADLNSFGLVKNKINPDLIIINACAVTHKATRDSRQRVAQLKRYYPQADIVVTGCFENKNWSSVDLWIDDKNKDKIINIIQKKFNLTKNINQEIQSTFSGRSRTLIKIQMGCNNFCSYCIVPFMRGQPKSCPVKQIIKEIKIKERQGFQEVVLTGVNIGLYNNQGNNLVNLLKNILKETNIPRIRLGSLWPTHITSQLINLYTKESRLCPHFHLSVQSGSDKILKLMRRSYRVKEIKRIVNQCQAKIPYINFTTDIIVGFPGETEQDFQDSCQLIKDIPFSKVHIFKYSKRPGTLATNLPNQVAEQVKNKRSQALIKLADKLAIKNNKRFIGQVLPILWEHPQAGYHSGFTNNYLRVKVESPKNKKLTNTIGDVKLTKNHLVY